MSSNVIANGANAPLLAPERRGELLRLGLLSAALLVGLVPVFRFVGSMFWFREFLGDWQVFWINASAPLDQVYGRWLFPYPVTALFLVRPFGLLPFWPSLVAWGAAGSAAISFGARRMLAPRALAIGLCSSAAVTVLVSGQISLFIGALVIAGLSAENPRWRGLCLGAAAVIKPQSLLAAPVAMIARRDWRGIGWAAAAACALVALSLAVFGFDAWLRWATNLHRFQDFLTSRGTDLLDIGLYGIARSFGLPGWTFAAGIPLGVATAWLAFRRQTPLVDRYAAFVCATVLMSPYTMPYDLAGLSFACVAMLLDPKRSPLVWLAAALIVSSVFANVGIVMMALVLSYEALSTARVGKQLMHPGISSFRARKQLMHPGISSFRTSSSAASPR
jgi:hypothetical protein